MFLLSACSVTRQLKGNETLVTKNAIKGVDKEFADPALLYIDKTQQPNNKLNLQLWLSLSGHGKRNIGEEPRLLDSNLVEYSRLQIEKFLQNKGYLKAKVTDSIVVKKKRASLFFTAKEGTMFKVRKFQDSIADPKVRQLYRTNRTSFSHIQPGGRFDTDSLAYDRDEFYLVMKRHGYFDFYRQYIRYDYDSTFNSGVVDVKMIISNPTGKTAHLTYTINNTLVTIVNSNGRAAGKADTVQVDSQFRFVDYSKGFKPRYLTNYMYQKKGDLYNIDQQTLTTSRLSELNVFRNVPNPSYKKLGDSTNRLDNKIDIIPLKRMSDRVEGEFLFAGRKYGYNLGNTFTDRNLFHGAEILEIKTNWSVLFDNNNNAVNGAGIQNQDLKVGANLIFPRIVSPLSFPHLGKYGVPHTTFSTNYQLFFQKGLVTRQSFINSLTYDWAETTKKLHSLTPINIEFSRGTIDPIANAQLLAFNRFSYVYLIGRTIFTTGSQYTFQQNANMLNTLENFTYFRGFVDVGGNTLSLLAKLTNAPQDSLGRKLFGYHFAQYAKTEVDLRVYKHTSGEQQLVFRLNPGIGIPYGNSGKVPNDNNQSNASQLIFEKNFYVGGASDIRAWLPRTLGPGNFNRGKFYGADTTTRTRLKYLDQFGEIKIVGNVEYRYKIADNFFGSKLKGATFMDFGNVWRLHNEAGFPGGQFKFNNLLSSTAMGIGTGFRLDLTFFVFRFDAAFKFKDPQFTGADQFVLLRHLSELFTPGSFKQNYFAQNGESYNFMQLNFGIGLPF